MASIKITSTIEKPSVEFDNPLSNSLPRINRIAAILSQSPSLGPSKLCTLLCQRAMEKAMAPDTSSEKMLNTIGTIRNRLARTLDMSQAVKSLDDIQVTAPVYFNTDSNQSTQETKQHFDSKLGAICKLLSETGVHDEVIFALRDACIATSVVRCFSQLESQAMSAIDTAFCRGRVSQEVSRLSRALSKL